ncbi:MAG TPA: hypothetical protein DCL77_04920 [Prolixibacteraceae bacterium]|jgi:hypothetical protein|nr:hypothetical protein [Prolixibacteraceae bacterium]
MVKKENLAQMMSILGIMKVTLIIVLGTYILISSRFDYLPKYFRPIFAILIIAYGVYRLVSVVIKLKNKAV